MSNYNQLYTPQDSAVVFIDHQPKITFGVAEGRPFELRQVLTARSLQT